MPDVIRVTTVTGSKHDHQGIDWHVKDGVLTITQPSSAGGEENVASYPSGRWSTVERLPEGTEPADNTPVIG